MYATDASASMQTGCAQANVWKYTYIHAVNYITVRYHDSQYSIDPMRMIYTCSDLIECSGLRKSFGLNT